MFTKEQSVQECDVTAASFIFKSSVQNKFTSTDNNNIPFIFIIVMKSVTKLFVYGSLRSGFRNAAYDYISRYFNFLSDAKVKGKLYDMGDYPAAIATVENNFIVGELYEIKDEEEFIWALAQLDDYEGLNVEIGEQALYKRELVTVFINDKTEQAWIYWFAGSAEGKPIIANGDMLAYLYQKNK
jgi:gamma-glutamylcyclotransferase (GGCT)/AIG2-like uncharacterized protein YtfP